MSIVHPRIICFLHDFLKTAFYATAPGLEGTKGKQEMCGQSTLSPQVSIIYVKRTANKILQGILSNNAQTNTLTEK